MGLTSRALIFLRLASLRIRHSLKLTSIVSDVISICWFIDPLQLLIFKEYLLEFLFATNLLVNLHLGESRRLNTDILVSLTLFYLLHIVCPQLLLRLSSFLF
jgi:hypothetical protein